MMTVQYQQPKGNDCSELCIYIYIYIYNTNDAGNVFKQRSQTTTVRV